MAGLSSSEMYDIGADIMKTKWESEGESASGKVKKFFASAITPDGLISFLRGCWTAKKVYVIKSEVGGNGSRYVHGYGSRCKQSFDEAFTAR